MNTQLHPRCVTFRPMMTGFQSEGAVFMAVTYDCRDSQTEMAMRLACALFDTPIPGLPKYLHPMRGERLAILKLDETHLG